MRLRASRAARLLAVLLFPATALAQLPLLSQEPFSPIAAPGQADPRLVRLGERLFEDDALSGDGKRSCASCHDVRTNGASGTRFDQAAGGGDLALNTPTVFNAALSFRLDWPGDVRTLEQQADESLRSPKLMGAAPTAVVDRLNGERAVREGFETVFSHRPDWNGMLVAIAAYERTLVTPGARFDRWLAGDRTALTDRELAGLNLFKSIGCVACHQGVNVGGNLLERQGVVDPRGVPSHDLFRVPSLRNVAATPPYFHDGSASTLDHAVHQMATAQLGRELSQADTDLIVAFLGTLTGRYAGHAVSAQP